MFYAVWLLLISISIWDFHLQAELINQWANVYTVWNGRTCSQSTPKSVRTHQGRHKYHSGYVLKSGIVRFGKLNVKKNETNEKKEELNKQHGNKETARQQQYQRQHLMCELCIVLTWILIRQLENSRVFRSHCLYSFHQIIGAIWIERMRTGMVGSRWVEGSSGEAHYMCCIWIDPKFRFSTYKWMFLFSFSYSLVRILSLSLCVCS